MTCLILFVSSLFQIIGRGSPSKKRSQWIGRTPTLREVTPLFLLICPQRKMRSLISKESEPPVSANRFPNMRALVPKVRTPQASKVTEMSFVFIAVSPFTSFIASYFF
ncbi:hypothetical protein NPIL_529931 [Nephila pilipes]|uniref:Spider venom protein n=1 Tax=Nephila pilipes TaxID=299642 RepID=A0A8X6NNT1_NEPPI|nr:hypothetical protein NPIL_529931 [Nephila pilipes]